MHKMVRYAVLSALIVAAGPALARKATVPPPVPTPTSPTRDRSNPPPPPPVVPPLPPVSPR